MKKPLVIRVDADSGMGAGHVMRCLALAQAWSRRGGTPIFAGRIAGSALRSRLSEEGLGFHDLESCSAAEELDVMVQLAGGREAGAFPVVLDGYGFDEKYQQSILDRGAFLLVVDDYAHLPVYHADIILNQNVNAHEIVYRTTGDPKVLSGLDYCLLREEFLRYSGSDRKKAAAERPENILVTMGGADPDNATLKVLEGIFRVLDSLESEPESYRVRAVVGPLNPHFGKMESFSRLHPECELMRAVTDMPGLLDWTDVAISAAGSTCWELAWFQIPVCTAVLAENQEGIARGLHDAGAAINLGRIGELKTGEMDRIFKRLLEDSDLRARMATAQRGLVDGRGAERVCKAIEESVSSRGQ